MIQRQETANLKVRKTLEHILKLLISTFQLPLGLILSKLDPNYGFSYFQEISLDYPVFSHCIL